MGVEESKIDEEPKNFNLEIWHLIVYKNQRTKLKRKFGRLETNYECQEKTMWKNNMLEYHRSNTNKTSGQLKQLGNKPTIILQKLLSTLYVLRNGLPFCPITLKKKFIYAPKLSSTHER